MDPSKGGGGGVLGALAELLSAAVTLGDGVDEALAPAAAAASYYDDAPPPPAHSAQHLSDAWEEPPALEAHWKPPPAAFETKWEPPPVLEEAWAPPPPPPPATAWEADVVEEAWHDAALDLEELENDFADQYDGAAADGGDVAAAAPSAAAAATAAAPPPGEDVASISRDILAVLNAHPKLRHSEFAKFAAEAAVTGEIPGAAEGKEEPGQAAAAAAAAPAPTISPSFSYGAYVGENPNSTKEERRDAIRQFYAEKRRSER